MKLPSQDFESCASADSATSAYINLVIIKDKKLFVKVFEKENAKLMIIFHKNKNCNIMLQTI